jgi:hypothetical protein
MFAETCRTTAATLIVILLLVSTGCGGPKEGTRLPMGATTIEELVERYRRAHERKDIEDLRGILAWEPHLPSHRPPLEKPIRELFEMPLAKVSYIAGPKLYHERGGEATYLFGSKEDSMSGPICGKILLVEKTDGNREPRTFDPSYIVIQAHNLDGRYYIDILQPVAEDAARAYKTNTSPRYQSKPLEAIVPFKKK